MSDREVPRVFVSYAHDSTEHKEAVREFATYLMVRIGLQVQLDQWDSDRRRDWSLWAIEHLTDSDYILVIASPDYKQRADGRARSDEGRGSQFEAAIMRDALTRDLRGETERWLPVVLPGRSVDDIPTCLCGHSTTRFHVDELSEDGVAELIGAITGKGRFPTPERGEWLGGRENPESRQLVRLADESRWAERSGEVKPGTAVLGGVRYDDSIVLRGSSRHGSVVVDLERRYRRMTTVIGVLDDAAEPFQVGHFQVFLDGKPQPPRRVALDKPEVLEVDVTGTRTLRLEMARPGGSASPLGSAAVVVGRRLAGSVDLAWGNPTLV
ncbi:TIR domain-containing protein [Actinokineospora auranticolor]|uniref:NPCBM/NEW2 domain-containing protein n=1 Tax=Actinokineospora auranticolor TaxID=155976 RepID=A0A2S6GB83_9PSEU|nr:SEFIR domain-containing protein [Actinokineospora auranticolor]PPK60994.1 NPCBM/NEW2 domain-containing protein [Actinokineospora auranticolor]